jgi:hypothetical protein
MEIREGSYVHKFDVAESCRLQIPPLLKLSSSEIIALKDQYQRNMKVNTSENGRGTLGNEKETRSLKVKVHKCLSHLKKVEVWSFICYFLLKKLFLL